MFGHEKLDVYERFDPESHRVWEDKSGVVQFEDEEEDKTSQ
jgi:hypothetical protein